MLALWLSMAAANPYPVKVLRVIDGDTIEIEAKYLPPELRQRLSVRIIGIDTPEKGHRAQCDREADLARRASAYTTNAIRRAKVVEVDIHGWDKYGGRILGTVKVDGRDLATELVQQGLARSYRGGPKTSWCS